MSDTTPEVLVDETVALLREHPDLSSRFHIRAADGERSLPEVVETTKASAKKGEIVVFAEREIPEELGVLAGGSAYLYTVPIRVAILDGRTPALARTARTAVKQALRNVLLPSASGRITFTESWDRADELEADNLRVWDMGFEVDYDDILETIGYTSDTGETFRVLLEDGSGAILLEDGSGYVELEAA